MKTNISFVALFSILLSLNCGNSPGMSETKNEVVNTAAENEGNEIVGEWEKIGTGKDKNQNGKLDDEEIDAHDFIGFDYMHFYANGKCAYTTDHIETTWALKQEPKEKGKSIFIYQTGLPAGISEKEKDGYAHILRIFSIEAKKLLVKPAHLQGLIVAYKRK